MATGVVPADWTSNNNMVHTHGGEAGSECFPSNSLLSGLGFLTKWHSKCIMIFKMLINGFLANKLHRDLKLSRHVPLIVEFAVQVFEKVDDYFRNHTIKLNRRAY